MLGIVLIGFNHEPVTGSILIFLSIFMLIREYRVYMERMQKMLNRTHHTWFDPTAGKLMMFAMVLPMVTYIIYLAMFQDMRKFKD